MVKVEEDATYELNNAEPHEKAEGRFIDVGGLRLHYVNHGSGRDVIFLHGNSGSVHDWSALLDDAGRKYHAVAFDRPGHGLSERPAEVATLEVQARILRDALKQLKIERPLLVGHSWGGALALSFAHLYPYDASALLLLAPAAYASYSLFSLLALAPEIPLLGRLSLRLSASFMGRKIVALSLAQAFSPEAVPADYLSHAQSVWTGRTQTRAFAQDEKTFNRSVRALSEFYGEISLPTLILTGDKDCLVKPERNAYLLDKVIPQSRLIVLKGAGHQLPHTRHKEVLAAIDEAWQMADERA